MFCLLNFVEKTEIRSSVMFVKKTEIRSSVMFLENFPEMFYILYQYSQLLNESFLMYFNTKYSFVMYLIILFDYCPFHIFQSYSISFPPLLCKFFLSNFLRNFFEK